MSLLVLSPWEGDWLPGQFGTPKNRYLFFELERRGIETFWVYPGKGKYDDGRHVKFIAVDVRPPRIKPPALRYYLLARKIARRIPELVPMEKVELIVSMYWMAFAGSRLSRTYGLPHVVKLFGISANPLVVNVKNPLVQIRHFDLLPLKMGADAFVLENDGSNAELTARMFGILSRDMHINLQPRPETVKEEPVFRREGKIVVGYAGRLEKYKGMEHLIRIIQHFSSNQDVEFLIAGRGSYEGKLKRFTSVNLVSLSFDEMHRFYSSIDILINTATYANMTRPTVEAMAYGKPVVAFDVTLGSIIRHDWNGFLIRPFDWREMAHYIGMLVNDGELRKSMSVNALKTSGDIPIIVENIAREVEFYLNRARPRRSRTRRTGE